tara:strand:- start:15 stop:206 length:192 start_codon:yes stop_codon:yes gene_type:complete
MDSMNITAATFTADVIEGVSENTSIKAQIDGIDLSVPLDRANRHYAEIMRQVEAGTLVVLPAE